MHLFPTSQNSVIYTYILFYYYSFFFSAVYSLDLLGTMPGQTGE